LVLSLALSVSLLPARAIADEGGRIVEFGISAIHPTQSAIAEPTAPRREASASAWSRFDERFLHFRPRVVVGPGGVPFLIDGHHRMRDFWDKGLDKVHVRVEADWSALSKEDFWARMQRNGWVYLRDSLGREILPDALPDRIDKLGYDAHRRLAEHLLNRGGFERESLPFQEFHWADFLRSRLPLSEAVLSGKEELPEDTIQKALALARSPEARSLPGYSPSGRPSSRSMLRQCIGFFRDLLPD
jgi:hypothetical protein